MSIARAEARTAFVPSAIVWVSIAEGSQPAVERVDWVQFLMQPSKGLQSMSANKLAIGPFSW